MSSKLGTLVPSSCWSRVLMFAFAITFGDVAGWRVVGWVVLCWVLARKSNFSFEYCE